jgi:bifunctional non-homologous end joining protein LigD
MAPREKTSDVLRFVVQRHRATSDHYDLRLEAGGTLLSWAVPKGPTLDPTVRRTAFRVGDHPLEYLHFEGVIPEGQYGAGDVVVWDTGTWRPHGTDDPLAAVSAGELHADVCGTKLRGRLVLVRRGQPGDREQWLLVHKRDEHAQEGWDPGEHPRSVLSGRTNDEVGADPERLWHSDRPTAEAEEELRPSVPPVDQEAVRDLSRMPGNGSLEVYGRAVSLTNLDKVLFPAREDEEPVTKRELVEYAVRVAPTVMPYLRGRAMNLRRHPDGADRKGFWHKQRPDHAPDWLTAWDNPDADPGETTTYAVLDEPAAVVWAAQTGALEWHAWTSLTEASRRPTYALVDLDPGSDTPWEDVLVLARLHRTAFEHMGVTAYPKLTGGRGIQVWVPIAPGPDFAETRAWVEQLSRTVGAVVPELVSWKWEVRSRGGKARLDYTQNAVNKTLVAPYSPRARPGAPVSMPITWEELDDPGLRPDRYTVRSAPRRLEERGDLFRGSLSRTQTLPPLA